MHCHDQIVSTLFTSCQDACSADSMERSGGWLLEHVWRFCDELQERNQTIYWLVKMFTTTIKSAAYVGF